MEDRQFFDQQIEAAYQRLSELMEQSGGSPRQRAALAEALKSLSTGLEEPHATGEGPYQHEDQSSARQSPEAERKAVQATLKEERAFVSAVLDTVGALVVVLDREGRIVRFNRTCEQVTGYTFEEVKGRLIWDFLLAPEEVEPVRATFDNLRSGRFPNEFENYWVARDGSHRLIAWTNTDISGWDGGVKYVVGTGLDVTARRQAENEIRGLSRFPAENPNPVLRLDCEGALLYANEASEPLLREWGCRIGDRIPPFYYNLVAEASAAGVPRTGDVPCGERVYSFVIVPIVEAGYVNLYGQDITMRVRAESQREAALQALRESEERLRMVADFTYDWEYWVGPDGGYLYVSPSCERITGYRADEFTQNPGLLRTIVHPDDRALVDRHLDERFESDEATALDFRILTRAGEERWINHVCTPVYGAGGRPLGRRASNRDITERKQAESQRAAALTQREAALEELRETRDYLDNLLSYANAPIIVWDPDLKITRFNAAFERLTGLKAGDVLGRELDILFPEERKEEAMAHIRRAVAGERWEVVEIPIRRVDGTVRTVLWNSATLYTADRATPVATIAQGQDITGRVQVEQERERLLIELHAANQELQAQNEELQAQAEEMEAQAEELQSQTDELHFQTLSLEEERARLRAIIDSTPEAILVADEHGQVVLANPAAEHLFVAPIPGAARPEHFGEVTRYRPDHTPVARRDLALFRAAVHGEVRRDEPQALHWPDGRWRDVLASAVPIVDEHGRSHGAVAVYQDITEQMQAEKTLRETRNYLDNLLTYANAPIIVWDPGFKITRFNGAFERLTGLQADDVLGRELDVLFPGERKEEAMAHIRRAVAGERWETVEIPIRRVDGTVRIVMWNSATLYAADGTTPVATIAQGQDITERVQAESQREAALAERERLLEQARHDRASIASLAQALETERDTLQTIMESTHAQLAYLDPDFSFVRVNSAYARGSGHSREELIGHGHFDLFPNAENQAIFEQVRDTGQPAVFHAKPFEYADQPERGVTYWDWTLVPVKEGDGRVRGLVLSLLDVTDQVRAGQERERLLEENRRQREFMERLLAIAPIGVAVLRGPDHRYEFANAYFQAISGPPDVPLVGRTMAEAFPTASAQGSLAAVEAVYRTGQTVSARGHEANLGPGRERTYWDTDRLPLKAPDGSVEGVLVVAHEVTEEVLARRKIQEMAARDEAILSSLAEGVITLDMESNILMVNPAALRLQGFEPAGAPQNLREYLATCELRTPDGRSLPVEEWPGRRLLHGETFNDYEVAVCRRDTGRTWLASYGGALARDASGRATMAVLTLRDVTAQKLAERERERLLAELQAKNEELQCQAEELEAQAEELRSQADELHFQTLTLEQERARLRAIIDSTPEAILVADERGQVVLANPAAAHLFAEPISGAGGLEYYGQVTRYRPDHTPYEPHERPCFRAAVHRETQNDLPIALLWPDGEWRDVLVNAAPILDSHGQVHGAVAIYQDITERQRAQSQREATLEALRETRDYLDNLLTYANAPIIVWDPDFKITRFNGAFERLTGLKADDVLGRELDILFPEDRRQEAMAYIRRAVAGERWETVEIPIQRVDGTVHTVLWNSATLYAADGTTPVATIAQGQDITERVRAEEELKAALAEKEVLMREIYHRVKNNLQALIYLMDMQADYIPDEATRQMIRELQERARSMALVHEKLYQSQNLARIDFGDYLRELVDNVSRVFGTGRLIVWRIEAENALLSVDTAIPCGLVVTELLTNAMKYAFPDGQPRTGRDEIECKINVEFRAEGERFMLVVADNGVGLPPGLDWTTTPSLGMQLINVLARHQLGAQVEVDTHAGTAFKITFAERKNR
jgi:PAS domain S-box-containing protein